MRMDLQHIKRKSDEADAAMKLLQAKMDSLVRLVEEEISENKRLEES